MSYGQNSKIFQKVFKNSTDRRRNAERNKSPCKNKEKEEEKNEGSYMFKRLYSTNSSNLSLDTTRERSKENRDSVDSKRSYSSIAKPENNSWVRSRPMSSKYRKNNIPNPVSRDNSKEKIAPRHNNSVNGPLSKQIKDQISKNVNESINESNIDNKKQPVKIKRKFSNTLNLLEHFDIENEKREKTGKDKSPIKSPNPQKSSIPKQRQNKLDDSVDTKNNTNINNNSNNNYIKSNISNANNKKIFSNSMSVSRKEIGNIKEEEKINTKFPYSRKNSLRNSSLNISKCSSSFLNYDKIEDMDDISIVDSDSSHDGNQEKRACHKSTNYISIIGRRKYLRFRQLYDLTRPEKVKDPKQFFKMISNNHIVRYTLEDNGFKECTCDKQEPSIIWSAGLPSMNTFNSLQRFQKINHFPHSNQLCRKDQLQKNLSRMAGKFGRPHFDFIPLSQVLPFDKGLLASAMLKDPFKWQIVKPVNRAQGKGIQITNKFTEIKLQHNQIISEYIDNPLLIDELKFDVRLQVIVTSQYPLRVQLQEEGLVRFATEEYEPPNIDSKDMFMHLTNQSINKNSSTFEENENEDEDNVGHKWSQSALLAYLEKSGIDLPRVKADIEDIIVKSLLSVEGALTNAFKNNVQFKHNCFEIQGFDILLTDKIECKLIEINLSPALQCNSPLDLKVKGMLIKDTMDLVGVVSNETRDQVHKQDMNPLRPVNMTLINHSSASRLRPQSQKEKKENWSRLDKVISNEQGIEPSVLSREEKHQIRDIEDEYSRMHNMKNLLPRQYKKYKHMIESSHNLNDLLSKKQFKQIK